MSKLVQLLATISALVLFMGANEGTCHLNIDLPDDPCPDEPPDHCEQMVQRCEVGGGEDCLIIDDFCRPPVPEPLPEPDFCEVELLLCLEIEGDRGGMCEDVYMTCVAPDPCSDRLHECLDAGVPAEVCELDLRSCLSALGNPYLHVHTLSDIWEIIQKGGQ